MSLAAQLERIRAAAGRMLGRGPPADRATERAVKAALQREALAALRLILTVRFVLLGVMALWILLSIDWERARVYLVAVAGFALVGVVGARLGWNARRSLPWVTGLLALDMAILTALVLTPISLVVGGDWPPQLALRFHGFLYLFVLLAAAALTHSPAVVLLSGLAAAVIWGIGFAVIASLPTSILTTANQGLSSVGMSMDERLAQVLHPNAVSLTLWQNSTLLILLTAGVLAVAMARARGLLRAQVRAEASRTQLARFFSPNVVDAMRAGRLTLQEGRKQAVAILFVDLVGFTTLAARLPAEGVVALLRNFHRRMARAIFAQGGTLDKYVGDCVMATFGTPEPTGGEAGRALATALAMLEEMAAWNARRAKAGRQPLAVGIGIHWGEVVVGNVGDAQRLEYTVVGDAVNIASRLERLTRALSVPLVASDAVLAQARAEGMTGPLGQLVPGGSHVLRGRSEPMSVWLGRAAPGTAPRQLIEPSRVEAAP